MHNIDPLQSWIQLSRTHESVLPEHNILRALLRKLPKYFAVHSLRSTRPIFEQDLLRQQDCLALELSETPLDMVAAHEEHKTLRVIFDKLYAQYDAVDEPWIERQALHVLGYLRAEQDVSWWTYVLERSGDGDPFAEERRMYALAALAWRAVGAPQGEADEALCSALSHSRASVRATATMYLMAVHRVAQRGFSMREATRLHQMASGDPSLEPRAIARIALELDRIECAWDHPNGVYRFAVFLAQDRKTSLGEVSVKTVQTAAHLHHLICALRKSECEQYTLALGALVRGRRFDLCRTDKFGRLPAQLQLGGVGIRKGEQLLHHSPIGDTVVLLRDVVLNTSVTTAVPWPHAAGSVLLLETPVNGTRFHQAQAAMTYLRARDTVRLHRESSNPHDDRAVEVMTERGDKLGYIPRGQNRVIASLMDAGESTLAVVVEIDNEGEFPVIFLRVFSDPKS